MKSSPVTTARSTPSVVLMASCVPIRAPGFSVNMHNQMTYTLQCDRSFCAGRVYVFVLCTNQ